MATNETNKIEDLSEQPVDADEAGNVTGGRKKHRKGGNSSGKPGKSGGNIQADQSFLSADIADA